MLHQDPVAPAKFPKTAQKTPQNRRAKVPLKIETKRFTVGICDNDAEFWESIKLRDEVFRSSFPNLQVDLTNIDSLDHYADFLYVRDHESDRIVASYRLIHSSLSPFFYSQDEFDLTELLNQEGSKLELSRACVADAFRNGVVLHLLWKGIASYMMETETQYLFGLTSIQTYDLNQIFDIYRYLHTKCHIGSDFEIHPTKEHNLLNWYSLNHCTSGETVDRLPSSAPALLSSYLRAGAKVYGAPAVDHTFGCFDFFTVLESKRISKSHSKKYLNN